MQTLSTDQIRKCTRGAIDVVGEDGAVRFLRFPEKVLEYYHSGSESTATRSDCAAGIVLAFETDAARLCLEADVPRGARDFGYVDLYLNGRFFAALGDAESPGHIGAEINLPETDGEQLRVELYLPHCRVTVLRSLSLSDGAGARPLPQRPVWLAVGDSITQGMNGLHPSLIYPSVAARRLGMTVHNAGVGGAVFDAETLREPPVDSPELITVAYGINDFNGGADATPARPYLRRLRELYPDVPVAVLEPIWASRPGFDCEPQANEAGITLQTYRHQLGDIVAEFENMCCLSAAELLPAVPEFVPDGVHPNDPGHQVTGENLAELLGEL